MPLEPDALSLRDRLALVTGAAMGIGEAIALSFARCGADLAICDRDEAGLAQCTRAVEASGRRCFSAVLDVRDESAVRVFVAEVAAEASHIDILVNNAGGTFLAPFLELSGKGQSALVDENFSSVTHLVRSVVPHMRERGGSIINITSIEAHRAGPGYAVYSAMKAAVESLTKSLALELGLDRIRVNCIAPDAIPTPGIRDVAPATPLSTKGCPDDVAGAALYLAGDLSNFVTGATLHVDGGNRAAGGWRRTEEGGFGL